MKMMFAAFVVGLFLGGSAGVLIMALMIGSNQSENYILNSTEEDCRTKED